jgi:iron complex transport system permease protein
MNFILKGSFVKYAGLVIGIVLLIVSMLSSIVFGFTEISWKAAIEAYTDYDPSSNEHIIIQTTRTPRALIAAAIGASLAIAGALMQALTRNPLASPSILGINASASAFVVFAITVLSISILSHIMWIAFMGAGVGALAVYFLGSLGRDGLTPLKIILAGAAMTALFSSFTQGMLVINERGLEQVLFWLTGSVAGRTLEMLTSVFPYMAFGWIAAIVISRQINLFVMGEDVAKGLGQRTALLKIFSGIIIVLLAGSAVAVAGPIGFIGIIIPHIVRYLVGMDYRWVIPYCGVLGAILLVTADIFARFIIMPAEVPVGVMTAIIGTPFFIYIARRGFNG